MLACERCSEESLSRTRRSASHGRPAKQTEALLAFTSGVEVYGERFGFHEVYRETPSLCAGFTEKHVVYSEIVLTTEATCATLRGDFVMERDRGESEVGPVDVANAADLVGRAIRDIDASDVPAIDVLLTDLLCAAWPTPRAQSQ
jgi:hypothetical protein